MELHPHPNVLVVLPSPGPEAVKVAEGDDRDDVSAVRESGVTDLATPFHVLVGMQEGCGTDAGRGEAVCVENVPSVRKVSIR